MKDKKQKISFDKRYLLLLVAGFLTGRVWLYGINPFGGHCLLRWQRSERAGNFWLFLFWQACLAAQKDFRLLSISRSFCLFCHSKKIQEKWTSHTGQAVYLALLTGGLNMAAGILNSILAVNTWEVFWLSILESVMVFGACQCVSMGVCILFCMKSGINYLTMRN